jgi:uncharacterized protein (DUF433 family)
VKRPREGGVRAKPSGDLPCVINRGGVEWDKDGFVARLYPFTRSRRTPAEEAGQPRVITMDPRIEFGRPVLKSSAVPTAVIADRYKAGESIADLAEDYGEDPLNIEEAVRCELQPAKAA